MINTRQGDVSTKPVCETTNPQEDQDHHQSHPAYITDPILSSRKDPTFVHTFESLDKGLLVRPSSELDRVSHDLNEREQSETSNIEYPFPSTRRPRPSYNNVQHEVDIHEYTGCGRRHSGCDKCSSFLCSERWMLFINYGLDSARYLRLELDGSLLGCMSSLDTPNASDGHQGLNVLLWQHPSTSLDGRR